MPQLADTKVDIFCLKIDLKFLILLTTVLIVSSRKIHEVIREALLGPDALLPLALTVDPPEFLEKKKVWGGQLEHTPSFVN